MVCPMRVVRRGRVVARRGFSLIEIVIAIGIIAFAIVGIMGLFPVAMRSALESQRETRAAVIAQQIFSDLQVNSGTVRRIFSGSGTNSQTINLAVAATNPPIPLYFDESGRAEGPTASANSIFLANLYISPDVPITGVTKVEASIETPAAAASSNRTRYSFVTLLNQK
jgi:uncharacterized protein (TIGR02598 family)